MLRFRSEADRELVRRFAQGALAFAEAVKRGVKGRWMRRMVQGAEASLIEAFAAQEKAYLRVFELMREEWPIFEGRRMTLTPGTSPLEGRGGKVPNLEAGRGGINQVILWREAIEDGNFESALGEADDEVEGLFLKVFRRTAAAGLQAGFENLMAELGLKTAFDLKNPRALAYLAAHGAELVKQINDVTREQMKYIVNWGLDHGWSYKKTAQAIQEQFKDYRTGKNWWNFDSPRPQGHIDSRAHLIAVTESGNAYEAGGYQAAEELAEAGIEVEKMWSTMGDDLVSDGCAENEAEGWIPYDQEHRSGDLHPLRFPGCRCDELYQRAGSE